jgi:hypothetical protein
MKLATKCKPAIEKAFKGEEYRTELLLQLVALIDHKRQKTRLYRRTLKALSKANKGA